MLRALPALLLPCFTGCGVYHRYQVYQDSPMCREEREWCGKCHKADTEEEKADFCQACDAFKRRCVEDMDRLHP